MENDDIFNYACFGYVTTYLYIKFSLQNLVLYTDLTLLTHTYYKIPPKLLA